MELNIFEKLRFKKKFLKNFNVWTLWWGDVSQMLLVSEMSFKNVDPKMVISGYPQRWQMWPPKMTAKLLLVSERRSKSGPQ